MGELKEQNRENWAHLKEVAQKWDERYLLPVSQTKGMRDFIWDFFRTNYMDGWGYVMDYHTSMLGGYLRYGSENEYFGYASQELPYWFESAMKACDKYICSDGRIRYFRDEGQKGRIDYNEWLRERESDMEDCYRSYEKIWRAEEQKKFNELYGYDEEDE